MNDKNYDGTAAPDPFDRELDDVLANYAKTESRQGLENRIMARIKGEQEPVPVRFWWRWPAAAFAALSIILAIFVHFKSPKPTHYVAGPVNPGFVMQQPDSRIRPSPIEAASAAHASARPHRRTVASLPRLEQFPSPQPLSDQEKVLADYVARFRDEAVLIARVNTEELMREREQMAGTGASTDPAELNQKEITNR